MVGPRGGAEELARKRPTEEVAPTRPTVTTWIEALRVQDHPERNALLKRSLAEAV